MNDVKLLTAVLACSLNKNSVQPVCTDDELKSAYLIAKEHNVAQIFAYSVIKNNLTNDEKLLSEFNSVYFTAILRYNEITKTFTQLCKLFEKEKIEYMPLKGMVIRSFYPECWMRSSRDIDILVKPEAYDKACQLLRDELNYTVRCVLSYDTAFTTTKGLCVEIHRCLNDGLYLTEEEKPLLDVWEKAVADTSSESGYSMPEDLFLYYFIYHTAKHFYIGGCGIRPLVDLWFLKQHFSEKPDGLEKLLKENKLDTFTAKAEELCNVWFAGAPHTEETLVLEDYIIRGGQEGNKSVRHITAESPKKAYRRTILARIFVPFDDLKISYPILGKYAFLAPFCAIIRIFSVLFGKRRAIRINRRREAIEKEAVHKQYTDKKTVNEYISVMDIAGLDVNTDRI